MATNQIKLVITATDNSSTALKAVANNVNNLKIGVQSLSGGMDTAANGISRFSRSAEKTPGILSRVASGAKSALAVFGGYKLISGVFNSISGAMDGAITRLDTMDLFERKMTILTQDSSKATYALNEMKDATKGTAYGLGTAAKAVQNFVTRGMSTEDATKSIRTWMDAVAVYGNGTNQALESVINALGKMRSKGTVEMRHINTMINAGINPVQLYAKATNQSAAEVQEQLSAKTLRTEEFLNVVEEAMRTGSNGVALVTGKAKEMATTWQATFDNMTFALNRGWAELIKGADKLLSIFGDGGLKGIFKNFGVVSEDIMSGAGKGLQKAGTLIDQFYTDFTSRNKPAQIKLAQVEDYDKATASLNKDSGDKLRANLLNGFGGFADPIVRNIVSIQLNWSKMVNAIAEGFNRISPLLGQLFGRLFGQGVTSATELFNAFLHWTTLAIPKFFDWLQPKLQWLVDNWGVVYGAATTILKGFIAYQVLDTIGDKVIGFNSKLVMLNQTLQRFTGGKIKIPTLEDGAEKLSGLLQNKNKLAGVSTAAKELGTISAPKQIQAPLNTKAVTFKPKTELAGFKNALAMPAQDTSNTVGLFQKMWDSIKMGYLNFSNFLGKSFGNLMGGINDKVSTSFNGVRQAVGGFSSKITGALGGAVTKVGNGLYAVFEPMVDGISYILPEGVKWVGSLAASFMGAVPMLAIFAAAVGAVAIGLGVFNPGNSLSNAINGFFENFNDLVLDFGNFAQNMIQNFANNIVQNGGKLREQGVNLVLSIVTGILTSIPNILATGIRIVGALIAGLVQILPTLVLEGFNAMGQFIAGIISAIPNILQGIGNMLLALAEFFLTNLPMFIDSGIQLVWNIIQGIGNMVGSIMDAIWNLLKSTWDWIISGDALAMFQDVGQKLIDWMIIGLSKTDWGKWLMDTFGVDYQSVVQQAETEGANTGQAYQDSLNKTVESAPDFNAMWNNVDLEAQQAQAQNAGGGIGQGYVDGANTAIEGAEVDADIIDGEQQVESASVDGAATGQAYTESATTALNEGAGQVGAAANSISSALTLTFDSAVVQEQATNFVTTIAIVFTEQAPILYETVGNIGIGVINTLNGKINENAQTVYDTAIILLQRFKQGLTDGSGGLTETMQTAVDGISLPLNNLQNSVYTYGMATVVNYGNGIGENIPSALAQAEALKVTILEQLRLIPQDTYSIGSSTINAFHNGVVANEQTIYDDFTTIASTIGTTLETRLATAFSTVTAKVNTLTQEMAQAVTDNLGTLDDFLQEVSQNMLTTAQTEFTNFVTTTHTILDPLKDYFNTLGQDMMTNMAQGIKDKMNEPLEQFKDLVEKLKDVFEKNLGIHSPSDYMIWVGQMMLAGLMEGLSADTAGSFAENVIMDMQHSFESGTFKANETMDYLSQTGALDLIAKVTGMDLSAVENADPATVGVPAIIQEARKHLGYQSPGGLDHASIFGMHYGNPGAWCVSFVRYCAEKAGVPFPATNYVPDVTAWAQANGRWTMTPQPGYAAIFSNRHIELVSEVGADGQVTKFLGGNTSGGYVVERNRGGATGFVALDGGHPVAQTLAAVLQNAYNAKYNPGMMGMSVPAYSGDINALLASLMNQPINLDTTGSGLENPAWFQQWQPPQAVLRWAPQVLAVLRMLGQPSSLLKGVLFAINGESGGDPMSTYLGDINVIYGGSKGLLQTITPNFNKWKNPILPDDIYDPMQNIWTCLREMQDRYGGIASLINRKIRKGKWSGYAVGSRYIPYDMLAMVHQGEAIIPANQNPYMNSGGDYLSDLANAMFFEESGINSMNTSSISKGTTNYNQTFTINSPIEIHMDGNTDSAEIADNIAGELHRALQQAIAVGNPR